MAIKYPNLIFTKTLKHERNKIVHAPQTFRILVIPIFQALESFVAWRSKSQSRPIECTAFGLQKWIAETRVAMKHSSYARHPFEEDFPSEYLWKGYKNWHEIGKMKRVWWSQSVRILQKVNNLVSIQSPSLSNSSTFLTYYHSIFLNVYH